MFNEMKTSIGCSWMNSLTACYVLVLWNLWDVFDDPSNNNCNVDEEFETVSLMEKTVGV